MKISRSNPAGDPRHTLAAGRTGPSLPDLLARPQLVSPFLAVFEDPVGLDRPLWRDTSVWQGTVNASAMLNNKVMGVIARAGVSWGYEDPQFADTYSQVGALGMYRSSYHVIYTDQPVVDQADNWYAVHGELDVRQPVPRVIDFELDRGDSLARKADALWQMSELVLARDGLRPIIYTRYLLVDRWLSSWSAAMLGEHYWWLAQYLWDRAREHAGPPTLPQRLSRERVVLHQTADRKPPFPGEVQSLSVDWDRWEIGNEAEMHQWIDDTWGMGEQPPGQVSLAEWAVEVDRWARAPLMPYDGPAPPETQRGAYAPR